MASNQLYYNKIIDTIINIIFDAWKWLIKFIWKKLRNSFLDTLWTSLLLMDINFCLFFFCSFKYFLKFKYVISSSYGTMYFKHQDIGILFFPWFRYNLRSTLQHAITSKFLRSNSSFYVFLIHFLVKFVILNFLLAIKG